MRKEYCNQLSKTSIEFSAIEANEKRTFLVILLTLFMMFFEVIAGHITGSMALLADGYHMASHAGALGIAYLVYRLAKSEKVKRSLTFGSGKLLPLGGYTSAVGLGLIALWMAFESLLRFLNPTDIKFDEAILVSILGLVVNLISAFILGSGHHHDHHGDHHHDDHHAHDCHHDHHHAHHHDHHSHDHGHAHKDHHHHQVEDHNHKSALVHVLADAMTSVLAIAALCAGKYFELHWLDPVMGIVGAIVILKWAFSLCQHTAKELLDAQPQKISIEKIVQAIQSQNKKVLDIHLWKVGPANHACSIIVETSEKKGGDFYRQFFPNEISALHLVVEER